MFFPLVFRSASQRHPVPEEGAGAEVGRDYCGNRRPHSIAEQSGEGPGGLQRASESHCSLSGREVRLENDGQKRILMRQNIFLCFATSETIASYMSSVL